MDLEETDFQVFVAKFTYDPVALSPNENPDLELAFQESDYIFVYGEPDEVDSSELFRVKMNEPISV